MNTVTEYSFDPQSAAQKIEPEAAVCIGVRNATDYKVSMLYLGLREQLPSYQFGVNGAPVCFVDDPDPTIFKGNRDVLILDKDAVAALDEAADAAFTVFMQDDSLALFASRVDGTTAHFLLHVNEDRGSYELLSEAVLRLL